MYQTLPPNQITAIQTKATQISAKINKKIPMTKIKNAITVILWDTHHETAERRCMQNSKGVTAVITAIIGENLSTIQNIGKATVNLIAIINPDTVIIIDSNQEAISNTNHGLINQDIKDLIKVITKDTIQAIAIIVTVKIITAVLMLIIQVTQENVSSAEVTTTLPNFV